MINYTQLQNVYSELNETQVSSFAHSYCWLFLAEEMDKKDEEMRELLCRMWPTQTNKKKMLNLLVPPNTG